MKSGPARKKDPRLRLAGDACTKDRIRTRSTRGSHRIMLSSFGYNATMKPTIGMSDSSLSNLPDRSPMLTGFKKIFSRLVGKSGENSGRRTPVSVEAGNDATEQR